MADLRAIRREWERLLGHVSVEADWQRFFCDNPEALALSLPLRLAPCDFHALARPGKAEPDFWFFEQRPSPLPIHGLIELKTPDTPILSTYRRGTPVLSRAAAGAIEQLAAYGKDVLPSLTPLTTSSILLGNHAYFFVIIGLRENVATRLANDVFLHRLAFVPRNVRLFGYDELLYAFHSAPVKSACRSVNTSTYGRAIRATMSNA